jgi:predicted permease
VNKWIYSFATDGLIFGCFYAWQFMGIPQAKTFLTFVLWTFALLLLICGFFGDTKAFKTKKRQGVIFRAYTCVSTVSVIGLSIYTGMVALAIAYFIGWVFCQTKINAAAESA